MEELTGTTTMKLPDCGCCRFWRRDPDARHQGDWGECRRQPPCLPHIEQDKLVHVGIWPHTAGGDWCGEWQAVDAMNPMTTKNEG